MKMKNLTLFFLCIFYVNGFSQAIEIELFASGFTNPVGIKNAGDDRLFIVERSGFIRIANANGTINTTPFLNIDSRVSNSGGERGLLGLAFHPNYIANGFFYVNYINNSGNTVISRFTRNTPETADSNSELILLPIAQPFSNHNGGDMHFGSDNFLYIATGDGGSGGDPQNHGQRLNSLLGKILRIDVDNTSNGNNYAIPTGNPFFNDGNAATLDEIWAYGLRNPWRFSFDRQTDDLWIADVGQTNKEEINMASINDAGLNYGWRCYEGNSTFNTAGCPAIGTLTFPVAEYNYGGSPFRCSITGGYRYRGTAQPSLIGLYFFADFCSNEIGVLQQSGASWNITYFHENEYNNDGWATFGESSNGEIYIAGLDSGEIFRIIDANLSVDEQDLFKIKIYPNPAKTNLNFDFSNSNIEIESINLLDMQGKAIKSIYSFTNQVIELNITDVLSGLYIVEINAANGKKSIHKLIVN